jgi:Ca2+-binding RTX toxin-like protein
MLLAALPFCHAAEVSYASAAVAQAVPTCRGVPATIVETPGGYGVINGTPGDDVIVGSQLGGLIHGKAGDDLICGGPSSGGYQELSGGRGNDIVIGGSDNDLLGGGPGEDLLIGGSGDDQLDGGPNNDSIRGGPGADILGYVADSGDDEIYGGRGPDVFRDHDGSNTLRGGPGNDFIPSGQGNETIQGGRGRDTVSYLLKLKIYRNGESPHCHDITADLSMGTAFGAGFGFDTLDGIENVWTGGGNDVLVGDDGPNEFHTGSAYPCDRSTPHELVGGNGGLDLVTFALLPYEVGPSPTPLQVDLLAGTALWGDEGGTHKTVVISLDSIENVTGTDSTDVLLGNSGPNSFSGGRGDDILDGREGDDHLLGDKGDDALDGGPGANHNDGGRGNDTCLNPGPGAPAVNCES